MFPDWLHFVDKKSQLSLVSILHELSRLQDRRDLNFIVIGALPLLIRDYLKYTVCWDVDLLFKDSERLEQFMQKPKTPMARIVNYDDDLMISENITSFHTTWTFNHTWFNVDYILRKNYFNYYTHDEKCILDYEQSITLNDSTYGICLALAHPWDIIAEKVISPRMENELTLKIDMSVDIRHIFAVYQLEKDNIQFWEHVIQKARHLHKERECKKNFLTLLSLAQELGYNTVTVSPLSLDILRHS